MSLQNYVNKFTEADFEPGPFQGRSVLKGAPGRYYDTLAMFENDGYNVEFVPVAVGRYAHNGQAYFSGTLTLTLRLKEGALAGTIVEKTTVAASAEAESLDMGISGVQTTALGNALLRGLGMAAWLYEREPAPVIPPAPPTQTLPPPPQPQPQPAYQPQGGNGYNRRNPPGGGGYQNGGSGRPSPSYGPWDGSKLLKSGKYENRPYSEVRIEDLQRWASGDQPNKFAVMELERRMKANGNVPDAGGSAFSGGNGYQY